MQSHCLLLPKSLTWHQTHGYRMASWQHCCTSVTQPACQQHAYYYQVRHSCCHVMRSLQSLHSRLNLTVQAELCPASGAGMLIAVMLHLHLFQCTIIHCNPCVCCIGCPGNKLPALPQQQKASADVGLEYVNNLAQNLADIMELPYDRSSCSAASVQLLPHTQSDDAAATAGHRSGVVQDSIMYL